MRIAILHTHLMISGVSTFIIDMCRALKNRGIQVDVYVNPVVEYVNPIYYALLDAGVNVYNEDEPIDGFYDLVITNYIEDYERANAYGCPVHHIVHGTDESSYVPSMIHDYNKIITMSERSYDYVKRRVRYDIPIELIRNGVIIPDSVEDNIQSQLVNVLMINPIYGTVLKSMVLSASSSLGYTCRIVGRDEYNDFISPHELRNRIIESDIVIGTGRSIYEAMALGRAVIVFGMGGGTGLIDTEKKMLYAMMTNASGYNSNDPILKPTDKNCYKSLLSELKRYKGIEGSFCRDMACKYLNINEYIDQIISL